MELRLHEIVDLIQLISRQLKVILKLDHCFPFFRDFIQEVFKIFSEKTTVHHV